MKKIEIIVAKPAMAACSMLSDLYFHIGIKTYWEHKEFGNKCLDKSLYYYKLSNKIFDKCLEKL